MACTSSDGLDAVVVPNCNSGARGPLVGGGDSGEDDAATFPWENESCVDVP